MKLKYISWLPAVVIMGIIFYFSSKPVNNSNDSSLSIANRILYLYESITEVPLDEEARGEKLNFINHIVRKGAHLTEYGILAGAVAFHLWVWKRKGKRLVIIPIIFAALYASTDEFHQTFVLGRGGQIRDVLLDTIGAAMGTMLFRLIVGISTHRKKRLRKSIKSQQ